MSKSIGIDLGTTNSVFAVRKLHTEILKNAEGDLITPSCVTLKKSQIPLSRPKFIVGKHALEWMKQEPQNTVVSVKRLMGRSFNDSGVHEMIADHRLRYQIAQQTKGAQNSLAIMLAGKEYTPEEISAKILEKCRLDAETVLEDEVEYAVITVPAYFNDKQKHATRIAAILAGLKVRRLLPEPTAAAISFGVDAVKDDEAKTILVFDFGGGTFDLSVLTISGGQFIEQGKGGDMWLGGSEIDSLLSDYVLNEITKENQIQDMAVLLEAQSEKQQNLFLGELREQVEKAKIRLSIEEEACVTILGILKDQDGDTIDIDVELTRNQFDDIIAPIVETTVRLTQKVLEDLHFSPDLIDKVLLVGGSAKIPTIIDAMQQVFGVEKVMLHERPMLAIAEGAAILSHRLADTYECPQCGHSVSQTENLCRQCGFDLNAHTIESGVWNIVHSAAHDYYIHLENNEKHLFVEQHTPLPFEKTEVFKLVHSEQQLVHMKFSNRVNEKEERIGDLWLGFDLDELEEMDQEPSLHVAVTLKIDESNLIEVSATLKEFPDIKLSKTLSRGKADEQLFLSLEEVIAEANLLQYKEFVMEDLLNRTISIIKSIHKVVDPANDKVDVEACDLAAMKIKKAQKLAAEGKISQAMIVYAELALSGYGGAIPPDIQNGIRGAMEHLREMDEQGTFEENVQAIDNLNEELNKLGVVKVLIEIQKAGEICIATDQSKAPKFFQAIADIMTAIEAQAFDKANELINNIMPEVYDIVNRDEEKQGIIHKDIAMVS